MKTIYKILLWSILVYTSNNLCGQTWCNHGAYINMGSGSSMTVSGGMMLNSGTMALNGKLHVHDQLSNNGLDSFFKSGSTGFLVLEGGETAFHLSGHPIQVPHLMIIGNKGLNLNSDLSILESLSMEQKSLNLQGHSLTFHRPDLNENPFPVEDGFFWNGMLSYQLQKGWMRIPTGDGTRQQLLELQIKQHPENAMVNVTWKDSVINLPDNIVIGNRQVLRTAMPGFWSLFSNQQGAGTWDLTVKASLTNMEFPQVPASHFQLLQFDRNEWSALGSHAANDNVWLNDNTLTIIHEDISNFGNWALVQTTDQSTSVPEEAQHSLGIQALNWNGDVLEILFHESAPPAQLLFSDLNGRILGHQKVHGDRRAQFALPQLPDGMYLLTCIAKGKKPVTYKLISTQP